MQMFDEYVRDSSFSRPMMPRYALKIGFPMYGEYRRDSPFSRPIGLPSASRSPTFAPSKLESPMAQPDWTQLPKELIDAIAQRLDTPSEVLRFQSVCTTWRSSVTHTRCRLPNLFKVLSNDFSVRGEWGFYLSKRPILRVGLPGDRLYAGQPLGWIVKIEEDDPNSKHLLNPLSGYQFNPLPESFPKLFDPLKFRVTKIAEETVLQYITDKKFANSNRIEDERSLYVEKVVLLPETDDSGSEVGFVLLTIHVSGKLAIIWSGDESWTVIYDYYISPYDDVNVFQGKFYAVDYTGRMVHVDNDGNVFLVANSVFGGDKKYLVESNGELLLVDQFLKMDVRRSRDYGLEHSTKFMNERIVRFKVFRLNVGCMQWVEIDNLGDRLLFLGDNVTFSASACDFGNGCKGNCIYFMDAEYCSHSAADGPFMDFGMGVYHLQYGLMDSAVNIPGCAQLFWPPPTWTSPTMMRVRNNFSNLSIEEADEDIL